MKALRRLIRWIVVAAVGFVIFLSWSWGMNPSTTGIDDIHKGDAVVLFAGGRGERLQQALVLMEIGKADVLVLSNGNLDGWTDANDLCSGVVDRGFEVLCPTPDPDSTRGEARVFGELAEKRGWSSLVMVTSDNHVNRAKLLLSRCFDGHVDAVGATAELSLPGTAKRVTHEFLGHVLARSLARSC